MTNLMKLCYDRDEDRNWYVSDLESSFRKINILGSRIDNGMQVAILLVFVSSEELRTGTISAI